VIPCFAAGQAGIRRRFDPYRPWVTLLLHADGADGATTFTDHGPHNKTVTVIGNAQVDTSQAKWGGSLQTDGSGDGISVPNGGHFDFGAGDFWVEQWFKNDGNSAGNVSFIGAWGSSQLSWAHYKNASGVDTVLYMSANGTTWGILSSATGTTAANCTSMVAFSHLAFGRKGSLIGIWQGGTNQTAPHNIGGASLYAGGTNLYISCDFANAASMNGRQDEIRILKGYCPVTPGQSFTPNVAPWANAG
jgi:hypothetical protein